MSSTAIDTYVLLRSFVDELVRCGMRAACTSPGSRSAPLVLSLAREPRLCTYSHVDERCAGFFAVGLAKATGLPVAVACTSGTAAAELLPAAVEAHEARVPLLLLTADRPSELRENGAGQAIDQLKLYGSAAKWFFEVQPPGAQPQHVRWMRTLACRAYWTALEGRPGVVHLNFPLREPLVPDGPLPAEAGRRDGGAPFVARGAEPPAAPGALQALARRLHRARRGVVVAGRHERPAALGPAAASFAARMGWPLLADPMSGARRGGAAIAHYDALLRDTRQCAALRPDLVLRVGDLPVSKPLRAWLAGLDGVPQVALDPEGAWQDPDAVLSDALALDPVQAFAELEARAAGSPGGSAGRRPAAVPAQVVASATGDVPAADCEWLEQWRSADERAAEAIHSLLGDGALTEPAVAAELGVLLPEEATLFVASSMPVREIETFWPVRDDPPRVLCNRGANGIDGTVSSAFGAAAGQRNRVGPAGPVVLLIGDVALAHDIGGLLAARRLGLELTIVLIDNGGGGIFDFLPVAGAPVARSRVGATGPAPPAEHEEGDDAFTRHIATPTGLDFGAAAVLYGLSHDLAIDVQQFRAALERALAHGGSSIIEVRGDRAANVALHRRVWGAVSAAL